MAPIYEEDFLGFSYGFRPGRGQHDALDALCVGIGAARVNWILDADICGRRRNGGFQLQRRTRGDRMRNRLQEIKAELRRHMHSPLAEQGTWLAQVLRGYYAYHAVPTNLRSLAQFRFRIAATWRRLLSMRSQKSRVNWERMTQIANEWLPQPRILHPWPDQRFAVKHPRWEPNA